MEDVEQRKTCNRYLDVGIPREFQSMNWDDVKVHDGIETAYNEARELDARLAVDDNHEGVGLTLFGPSGLGKSMLAALLACSQLQRYHQVATVPEQHKDEAPHVLFLTAKRYQSLLEEGPRLIESVQNEVRLLVLDALGKENDVCLT